MRDISAGDLLYPDSLTEGKVPKSAAFSCNAASTTAIFAAMSTARYRILGAAVGAASAAGFALYAGASVILGPIPLGANGNIVLPVNDIGWCVTSHGQALNGYESEKATITGVLIYVED